MKGLLIMKDEFVFIRSISPKMFSHDDVIQGIGDDAALLRCNPQYDSVVTADMFVEGVHFNTTTLTSFEIGYKALAANLSDLAAMGAIPKFYLVSIAIPKVSWTISDVKSIYAGMNALARTFQVDLIGGDTVSTSDALVISITAIGNVEKGRHLLRSHAEEGDIVFVTGSLGASAAGLTLLLEKEKTSSYGEQQRALIQAHTMPKPQIQAGRIFAQLNCRVALNDISDGIASEAYEIAEASGKKLILDYENIPKHPALQLFSASEIEQFVLYGGEDYQLIGCIPEQDWLHVKTKFTDANMSITKIGYVEDGDASVHMMKAGRMEKLHKRGYNHFNEHE